MIYLCMPTYGLTHPRAWDAFRDAESARLPIHTRKTLHSSILGECFNIFWSEALNLQLDGVPITRWVMLHNDVAPEPGWLDALLVPMDEPARHHVVSAFVPIKDDRGLTSTAYDGPDPWNPRRQIPLGEVLDDPVTALWVGDLLVNTGCMAVNFTRPWRKQVSFRMETGLGTAYEPDKGIRYRCRTMTEDWLFSRDVRRLGGTVCATRGVRLVHYDHAGRGWPNYRE